MANLGTTFDPNSVAPDTGRNDPLPDGRYVLQVVESDVVENSKKTGLVLKLTMEVFDGPMKGRKMFETLNIANDSVQAQEIGQKQLSALCHAAGITTTVTDSNELHFKPFEADVKIEAGNGVNPTSGRPYPDKNRIAKYHFEGADPAPAVKSRPAVAARPAAAAPAAGARPWKRAS